MSKNKPINLNEIPKKTPFKLPENYFEDFAKKMQEHTEANPHTVIIPFMVRIRPFLYIAASVLVILSVTFVALKTTNNDRDLVAKKIDTVKVVAKTMAVTEVKKNDEVVINTTESDLYTDDVDDEEMFDDVYEENNEEI